MNSALIGCFSFAFSVGFLLAQAGFKQASPFGFAALAAMVGMFYKQAVLKLKDVAETILAKPQPGKDAEPQDTNT